MLHLSQNTVRGCEKYMTGVGVVFWALVVIGVGSSLAVVLVRDIFKAALFLIIAFLTMAGFFVILNAEFLAVIQVLIYAGAISILIIFAIMMTRDVAHGNLSNRLQPVAFLAALLLLVAILFVVSQGSWGLLSESPAVENIVQNQVFAATGAHLGGLLVREFVLPFELVATLLLAALIGAIALVRE